MTDAPDTIVLVHGFWVTPRSWEEWIDHYEAKGFTVIAPAYPGFEVEVEALRADPAPIEAVTVPETVEHLEGIVGGLDAPPIIMGHSFGGALTQLLLDHVRAVAFVVGVDLHLSTRRSERADVPVDLTRHAPRVVLADHDEERSPDPVDVRDRRSQSSPDRRRRRPCLAPRCHRGRRTRWAVARARHARA